jgi:hypothetical protein
MSLVGRSSLRFMSGRAGLWILLVVALLLSACGPVQRPPLATPWRVHFTAAGDFDSNSSTTAVLNTIDDLNSNLTLALGDLSYGEPGEESEWCDYVTSHLGEGYPFEVVAGNHESDGQNGNIEAFASCLPNELPGLVGSYGKQYYVDVPAEDPLVRFIMISPGLTFPDGRYEYRSGSTRYNWTARAIDSARSKSIRWVVVGMHTPCISVGRYGCQAGADLFNLLLAKRVDLILSGHDHSYQRSKQLALKSGCKRLIAGSYDPSCVADSDSRLTRGAGSVAVVVGTGGRHQYSVSRSDSEAGYFSTFTGSNRNLTYGVLDVTLTPTSLHAAFVEGGSRKREDTFSITAESG